MTRSLLPAATASRFYKHWTGADPNRASMLAELPELSPSPAFFAAILQKEVDKGTSLPAAMRRTRNLLVAALIERDLSRRADLEAVLSTISGFAEFAVRTHLDALTDELVAVHGTPIGEESGKIQQMIVLGMGKLGGHELNVSSDIDLIFCYPEDGETAVSSPEQRSLSNHEFFTRLGKKLIAALSEHTADGFTFRVDMALRPNGASGPLVSSFNMVEEYLVVQGREWERYAWTKARALTGKPEDITALENIVRPFVFRRYLDFGAIDALRGMHAQIRAEVARQEARHPERNNNVKLGRGGIREIEFIAQVFQLIRGGRDAELRDRSTRATLRTLAAKGLLAPDVVERLLHAYEFLRNVEHCLQYLDDAQTHTLPANEDDRLLIAQAMGYADTPSLLHELDTQRHFVAARFDAVFSEKNNGGGRTSEDDDDTPAIQAALSGEDSLEAIESRLAELGFDDAAEAAKRMLATWQSPRLQSLPEKSRNQLIALVNTALGLIAKNGEAHAATLTRLLDFLEAIARRAAYLALLTEFPQALERVVKMIGASSWTAQYLTSHPILLDELLSHELDSAPDWPAFLRDCRQQLAAADGDTERQLDILREMHHAQQFRLLAQDLDGKLTVERLADHLSALADALVQLTIEAVWRTIPKRHREVPRFAVIAYGKLGGKELGYASDLDVVFLYDDDDQDAPALYAKLAQRFITWMTSHTPAGILFDIDIALRPNGASGLMVSSIAAFEKYQAESAWVWEHQALTRARFCAGDAEIGSRFETIRESVLRQPRDAETLKKEIVAMRQKMRDAHPNTSGLFDLKQDAGGMIDIEFIVQYLVLRHAHDYPQLTGDIGNIALLKLCGELGLIDKVLAIQVADGYRELRRLQHQERLQGKDQARVEEKRIAKETEAVTGLYRNLFGLKPC